MSVASVPQALGSFLDQHIKPLMLRVVLGLILTGGYRYSFKSAVLRLIEDLENSQECAEDAGAKATRLAVNRAHKKASRRMRQPSAQEWAITALVSTIIRAPGALVAVAAIILVSLAYVTASVMLYAQSFLQQMLAGG